MIEEVRRRAYLSAMQVSTWLPRHALPFAAPSRPELMALAEPVIEPVRVETRGEQDARPVASEPAVAEPTRVVTAVPALEAIKSAIPGNKPVSRLEPTVNEEAEPIQDKPVALPPPRFSLQLLRAGNCAILVELPTGEPFQSRDPAYLLLKDLLRAAGLPDSPQQVGDGSPIRWPLLTRGSLDQGAEAARDYVQGVLMGQLDDQPCACLWLIGLPAVRFAGEADEDTFNRELTIDGLGVAWALPGLESLMDEPRRKAGLWQAMRRVRQRWATPA
ncbi:energy transducer TonB [Pseudomonas sp. LRF_L74]|uniref:energy transducer TonB n=1 Tax=Pseudomonas sp. LRF_L74 TaxID=3369422 RepID=UPI003F6137DB